MTNLLIPNAQDWTPYSVAVCAIANAIMHEPTNTRNHRLNCANAKRNADRQAKINALDDECVRRFGVTSNGDKPLQHCPWCRQPVLAHRPHQHMRCVERMRLA